MKAICVLMIVVLSFTGCATERFQVTVTDNNGIAVSNAVVRLGFSSGHIVFARGTSHHYEEKTDVHGKAEIRFNCKSSQFGWSVQADGYYRSGPHKETLMVEVTPIPPIFYTVTMLEHEKEGKVTLWKRINPQPMYSYKLSEAVDFTRKVPLKNGRYGFDLKLGAWLPPLGKGEIADFYYVRNIGDEAMPDGSVAWLEFDAGCGVYFGKQTGCREFPSTYCANTNAVFRNRLPFMFVKKDSTDKRIDWRDIATSDEYMVLRTRVKLDPDGKVIEANYSKILGPFRFGYAVESPCVVFNHRVNDSNLESDCRRNMLKQFNSNGYPP